MAVIEVTDKTFEREVMAAELPVLIDLHAEWCQPCKAMAPAIESLSKELDGKLKVVKVDVDKNPMLAQSFRVQSVPMLVVMAAGQVVGHHLGALDKAGLQKLVAPALPRGEREVKPAELKELIAARRALPVDVREPAAYQRYRIPHAINVPVAELETRTTDLAPSDGRIRVLYSRTTDEAKAGVDKLKSLGIDVAYLEGGFLHWEADGFEVERGA